MGSASVHLPLTSLNPSYTFNPPERDLLKIPIFRVHTLRFDSIGLRWGPGIDIFLKMSWEIYFF